MILALTILKVVGIGIFAWAGLIAMGFLFIASLNLYDEIRFQLRRR